MEYIFRKVEFNDKDEILSYIYEFYEYNSLINGVGRLQDYVNCDMEDYDGWYKKIKEEEVSSFSKICYIFYKNDDKKIIGMVNIRMINDLKEYPYGHIGYSIRPTMRNMGFGKKQLYLALKELQNNNIDQCTMSCDHHNIVSSKIIKALGGIYNESIDSEDHYIIDVNKSIIDNEILLNEENTSIHLK